MEMVSGIVFGVLIGFGSRARDEICFKSLGQYVIIV